MLDFSASTLYNTDEAERLLSREIQRAQGFSLVFAVSGGGNTTLQQIADFQSRYPDLDIQHFDLREETLDLLGVLRENLRQPTPDAVFVTGLESWISGDLSLPVNSFVANLNRSRNSFSSVCLCPLVFWFPEFLLGVLSRKAPDFFSVHSGVHYFATPPDLEKAENLLMEDYPHWEASTPEEREERRHAFTTLLAQIQAFPETQRDLDMEFRVLGRLADLEQVNGHYEESAKFAQMQLELSFELFGVGHFQTADCLNRLGVTLHKMRRYSEAEPLHEEALAIRQKVLHQNHLDIATSLSNLAALYKSQERYPEAEQLYKQAFEIWKRVLNVEPQQIATSLNNLATLYDSQKRYQEAQLLYLDALELQQGSLPVDHPDIAQTFNNLGLSYFRQGRFAEAEPLLLRSREILRQFLGIDHPQTRIADKNYEIFLKNRSSRSASPASV